MLPMARCSIADITTRSYLVTDSMSSHMCADARRVWEEFTQTMQTLS
jgi:hypothetical protein